MAKPTTFVFEGYSFERTQRRARFSYRIEFADREPLVFTETLLFPRPVSTRGMPEGLLERTLESVHIMLGVSYYKLYCPPTIQVNRPLTREQAQFWNTVYTRGLGEFFYRNNLKPKVRFPFLKSVETSAISFKPKNQTLVGMGGGKDSIVAAELLKAHRVDTTAFVLETGPEAQALTDVVRATGLDNLTVRRILDPQIFEAHPESYNGHVPFSAIVAFVGYLTAVLYDYASIIVANERTSNFGNVKYLGEEINHQWSKSAEFEELFQSYARTFLSPDITYFSLLRPFNELRVAEMFTRYPEYFPLFTSCNRNFRIQGERPTGLWCGECPKCAYVFLLLAAFLPQRKVVSLFGQDLFEQEELVPPYRDLLGFGKMKPFDCVGTFEEARGALWLAGQKDFRQSLAARTFLSKMKRPERLVTEAQKVFDAPTMPASFRLFGLNNVLILGYEKEGRATERYLEKYFPEIEIGVADQRLDAHYLTQQVNFDLAIKTPGLPKKLMRIPYTTATNIFFSQVRNNHLIIGVTGTKGKSTTASLIAHVLRAAGKRVTLAGNIGVPMLEALMRPISPDEIFVVELSSYQLDDLEYSPHIAVALNLFPDHMDYHGGVAAYYTAKENITRFQNSGDTLIYNSHVALLQKWSKRTQATALPFDTIALPTTFKIRLLGAHNEDNIRAVLAVAHRLNVPLTTATEAIATFQPLPHRLEPVGEYKGIRFVDDAISTTPESTLMALRAIPRIGTVFLGGEDRGYDFRALEKELRRLKIPNIVLFPKSGARMLCSRKNFNILETKSMREAVRFAYTHTPSGFACLLSTASPSYSLWKNFEEKGDEFQKWVKRLGV